MKTPAAFLAAAAIAILVAPPSRAETGSHKPTIWERAANPRAAAEDLVLRSVEALLVDAQKFKWHTPMGKEQLVSALRLLESAEAAKATDVRLRFHYGRILSLLKHYERAASVLSAALSQAPDHPAATDAYYSIAICHAKLGRPADEIAAYDEFLRRETDTSSRANAIANRGEARMVQGHLPAAIRDLRVSLALAADNVLAHFSLAVALDRTGDRAGALSEAKIALTYDPLDQQIGSPNVFFMPPYDRYWYDALGAMARAQMINDAATAILWWETAAGKWKEYIDAAGPQDRWIGFAKSELGSTERELKRARASAAKQAADRDHRAPHRWPPM
jgi:tetratricopeptide (TPR) repeat protein